MLSSGPSRKGSDGALVTQRRTPLDSAQGHREEGEAAKESTGESTGLLTALYRLHTERDQGEIHCSRSVVVGCRPSHPLPFILQPSSLPSLLLVFCYRYYHSLRIISELSSSLFSSSLSPSLLPSPVMSTTIPESVTTSTTTTTTSTTAPVSSSHTDNPAAALDPLTSTTPSITSADIMSHVSHAAAVTGAALQSAAVTVKDAAITAGAAISSAAHNVDTKYHVSDKVSDATSHMAAALKQGNPLHAAKHASTAATIGDAERAKHEAGPLPSDAHVAGTSSTTTSSTITSSSTLGTSQTTTEKISNSAADVAAHVQASIAQGNPVHAAKYAGTAAMIGQAEREKHAHGPLTDEGSIKAADAAEAQTAPLK